MKKILIIISNNLEAGGVEFYLCNVLHIINLSNISIDLLVPGHVISKYHASILEKLGCNIIQLNLNQKGIRRYKEFREGLKCILNKCRYDVLHVNTGALLMEVISLTEGHAIPIRIAHSHGTIIRENYLVELSRVVLRKIVVRNATHMLACSKSAAVSLFGEKDAKKSMIAQNGIEVDKYIFSNEIREKVRSIYGWENQFVVGCVGRIAWEKNHKYLLHIFTVLYQKNSRSLLIIVGTGELEKKVKEQARELKIENHIQFMGARNDVNELMQGMDVFVLPSIREALGIVNIEAQAAGLHCIVSDVIPEEVNAAGLVDFLSLNESPEIWANKILEYDNNYERKDLTKIIKDKGFDLSTSAEIINTIYQS